MPQGKSSKFSPHAQKVGLNHVVSAGRVELHGMADGGSSLFLQVADEDVVSSKWTDHEEATATEMQTVFTK